VNEHGESTREVGITPAAINVNALSQYISNNTKTTSREAGETLRNSKLAARIFVGGFVYSRYSSTYSDETKLCKSVWTGPQCRSRIYF
jgi:hypothetical protein